MLLSAGRDEVAIVGGGYSGWLEFRRPHAVVRAASVGEILPALCLVENLIEEKGWYAVGFVSYEAAPAFDPALAVHAPDTLPLLWFGLFSEPRSLQRLENGGRYHLGPWRPSISREQYLGAIDEIKRRLGRGETYQVNFTYRQRAAFAGDPATLFSALTSAQAARHAAYIETPRFAVCSASPELFFKSHNGCIITRPMKGTAPRGLTLEQDEAAAAALRGSDKTRAENVMIVDMVRNDLARIPGARQVRVERFLDVEKYPTLLQMTSTVCADSCASFTEILAALFPCASITGAPKVSTMRIIRELETSPRGIYTGCIGMAAPRGGPARFNVAIRTVWVDKDRAQAEYGVGGGIVADSDGREEYRECQTKLLVLSHRDPEFSLLESMCWTPQEGYFLLWHHLKRLRRSAEYFGIAVDWEKLRGQLDCLAATLSPVPHKVRLLVAKDGTILQEAERLNRPEPFVRLGLALRPIDHRDRFLFHKTTHRDVHHRMLAGRPDCDDVIMWNERGEVTDTCFGNLVVCRGGKFFTPPVSAGLLAGTFREWLLSSGVLAEDTISIDEVRSGCALYVINSVRRWRPALFAAVPARQAAAAA